MSGPSADFWSPRTVVLVHNCIPTLTLTTVVLLVSIVNALYELAAVAPPEVRDARIIAHTRP